jgi:hypothetical protein
MSEYLFVTDQVAPLTHTDAAESARGLARGLLEIKHRVTILTIATAAEAASLPGLAKRLRKALVETAAGSAELALYEGHFSASDPQILVLESDSTSPGERALQLGGAAVSLAQDGLIKPEVVIGWGEASVVAMARLTAAAKLFVLPTGKTVGRFSPQEAKTVGLASSDLPSLASFGVSAAQAVIAPSRLSAASLEAAPELAGRASDEPIIALQFGANEPPFDPGTDPALPTPFDATKPQGKLDARKALLRRLSVSVDPRWPVISTGPRLEGDGGKALVDALPLITSRDCFVILPSLGDKNLVERAAVFAIEHPTKISMVSDPTDDDHRLMLAAADAWWLLEESDMTARAAGRALRYGALPLVPERSAARDYLVEWDSHSTTGNALFYKEVTADQITSTVARVATLRADQVIWNTMLSRLLSTAPLWRQTAAMVDQLRAAAAEEADLTVAAS